MSSSCPDVGVSLRSARTDIPGTPGPSKDRLRRSIRPGTNTYITTPDGLRVAVLYTKLRDQFLGQCVVASVIRARHPCREDRHAMPEPDSLFRGHRKHGEGVTEPQLGDTKYPRARRR